MGQEKAAFSNHENNINLQGRHYLALTLDMSGVFELTPGAPEIVWVVSRLEDDMSIFSFGRERLPEMKGGIKDSSG